MKIFPGLMGLAILAAALPVSARISVDRIDPPHWWTGMKQTSLQLQVYGHDIKNATFTSDYPGVKLDSVVRLDGSPNWQYVYLSITPDAKPGKMRLQWTNGSRKVSRDYELKERKPSAGAKGFGAGDVLYLVMPDRFADGDKSNNVLPTMNFPEPVDRKAPNARHGGDIKGIANHIDYLDSLGITAIWFNPVLENDMPNGSYHGYATTDYYRVDPRIGSNEEYAALIQSLHDRGIKTVMDMIFNHCGSEHTWKKEPPASDWFNFQDNFTQTNYRLSTLTDPYASDFDKKLTIDGWFVEEMPDLNQKNPHLWKYLVQNSIWWIEESGIDGIRMDTYAYIEPEIMAEWVEEVLAEYPDFNIVGECWFGTPAGEAFWQKGSPLAKALDTDTKLPTIMDFPFMLLMADMKPLREQTNPWSGLNAVYDHIALDYIYPNPLNVLRFLDNHDTDRFIRQAPDSLDQWKQAVTLLLTLPGTPQLYYGTELLMNGTREGGDGNVRKDIPGGFEGDTHSEFTRNGRTALQNEAYDFIAKINRWRRGSNAIAKGGMKHFMPTNGLYVFERKSGDDQVIVVLNGNDTSLEADMTRYKEIASPEESMTDILTGEEYQLIPASGKATFAPREIRILQNKR